VSASDDHLSRISTIWTKVLRAQGEESPRKAQLQAEMIERYSGAIYRYLLKLLATADAADEVFQEFALHWVQGGFRHADPDRGRFRDYLKTSLARMAGRYRQRQQRQPRQLLCDELPEPERAAFQPELDGQFTSSLRDELLDRTWNRLRALEQQTRKPYFTVLYFRARHLEMTSEQMAQQLAGPLGEPSLTAASVRKTLQRARQAYAELLLAETAAMLGSQDPESIEQEVIALGLKAYCWPAIQRAT
jgi:RNA polymerase sigma-70 factor (ECF subfamily)